MGRDGELYTKIDKILDKIEQIEAKLNTIENNVDYIHWASKKDVDVIDDSLRKIDKITQELSQKSRR